MVRLITKPALVSRKLHLPYAVCSVRQLNTFLGESLSDCVFKPSRLNSFNIAPVTLVDEGGYIPRGFWVVYVHCMFVR